MDEHADEVDAIEREAAFDEPPWAGDRDARMEVGSYLSRWYMDTETGLLIRLR